jgi:hypothetical protein
MTNSSVNIFLKLFRRRKEFLIFEKSIYYKMKSKGGGVLFSIDV